MTSQFDFSVNSAVPDNNSIGFSDTRQVSSPFTLIASVTIQLFMDGGWFDDLYAHVTHGSGFAILINRPGRSLSEFAGSGANSISVNNSSDSQTSCRSQGNARR